MRLVRRWLIGLRLYASVTLTWLRFYASIALTLLLTAIAVIGGPIGTVGLMVCVAFRWWTPALVCAAAVGMEEAAVLALRRMAPDDGIPQTFLVHIGRMAASDLRRLFGGR
jgi:hypothetical protein